MHTHIRVENARVHNLKGLTLDIPREQVVVFTGVSGSGKSSLVFDTLHTEAQRQLIETFSSFARRRLPKLSRPEVDEVRNLSTSIVIDQKPMGRTLRSTVGTATEVFTYLRMLFSRCGDSPVPLASFHFSFNHPEGMCQACKGLGRRIVVDAERLLDPSKTLREGAIVHPDHKVGGWNWRELVACNLFDPDKRVSDFTPEERDRLLFAEGVPITKPHGAGTYSKVWVGVARRLERFYVNRADDEMSESRRDAYQRYLVYGDCDACGGLRLNARALSVKVSGVGIGDAVRWEMGELDAWLRTIDDPVAQPLVRKMRAIVGHLVEIGVGYLSLARAVSTLSGGESQRVKMARQLDCDLTGLMYVLDEPSIGLHARDLEPLIAMLRRLRDAGNSVLVVEHDPAVISSADHVVEIGPGAGRSGGEVCFEGDRDAFASSSCLTARLMRESRAAGATRRSWQRAWAIRGAKAQNLKNVDVDVPQQVFVCITGVAGSGKSTLVHDVFVRQQPDAIVVDQESIGRTSRANAATFLGVFDDIRKVFAKASGRPASLFSFNSDGACPACKGQGSIAVEMNFLDDVRIECGECGGRRYTDDVLAIAWNGRSIHDVLSMTAREAVDVFPQKRIKASLGVLCEVGLDYLTLGQPLSTLSGGECQRLKLATELGKRGNLYVLDEPTTGLHLADIDRLMSILDRLVDDGNSVVVIEHNLDVISRADWVIDLGPDGGSRGGRVMAVGTPEQVAACAESHTGRYLRGVLRAAVV